MLTTLQSSSGNILDDEDLIQALDQAKKASITVKDRLDAATVSAADIQRARANYSTVPDRAVAIFYAAQALSIVNPMYQMSLECFRSVLQKSLQTSPKSDSPQVSICCAAVCFLCWIAVLSFYAAALKQFCDCTAHNQGEVLQERLDSIIKVLTDDSYARIACGLFHEHRLTFTFLLAASISDTSYIFYAFLRTAKLLGVEATQCRTTQASDTLASSKSSAVSAEMCAQSTCPEGLQQSCWIALQNIASEVSELKGLPGAVAGNMNAWIAYAEDDARSPMWSREPPDFHILLEQPVDNRSTVTPSLAHRALIALCWKPDRVQDIMHVRFYLLTHNQHPLGMGQRHKNMQLTVHISLCNCVFQAYGFHVEVTRWVIILLRCSRLWLQDLVSDTLGSVPLLPPPSASLSTILQDSLPIVMLLISPGTDPMCELRHLATRWSPGKPSSPTPVNTKLTTVQTPASTETSRVQEERGPAMKLQTVSLGRNQWRAAEAAVEQGATSGTWVRRFLKLYRQPYLNWLKSVEMLMVHGCACCFWPVAQLLVYCEVHECKLYPELQVCLQNCHLAESDLVALRNLVKNITHREDLHPGFRLVLTMAASPIIPSEMVATGPTVVLEPPRGFRARLVHALYALPDKMIQPLFPPGSALDSHAQHKHWIQTVLSVAMYHVAICEVWMNSTLC